MSFQNLSDTSPAGLCKHQHATPISVTILPKKISENLGRYRFSREPGRIAASDQKHLVQPQLVVGAEVSQSVSNFQKLLQKHVITT